MHLSFDRAKTTQYGGYANLIKETQHKKLRIKSYDGKEDCQFITRCIVSVFNPFKGKRGGVGGGVWSNPCLKSYVADLYYSGGYLAI